MQRYFLDLVEGEERIEDPDGQTFPDLQSAKDEAVLSARDVIVNDLRDGRPLGLHRTVEIRDEVGAIVAVISFATAIPPD